MPFFIVAYLLAKYCSAKIQLKNLTNQITESKQ